MSAFTKKRAQSKEVFSNVVEVKREVKEEEMKGEDLVGVVGKWKKTPKVLEKIETPPENYDKDIKNTPPNTSQAQIPITKQLPTEQPLTKK